MVKCQLLQTVMVTELLFMEQIFGGGVQENSLFLVARKPDSLQPRLLVLCHMENHAKFQVYQALYYFSVSKTTVTVAVG